MEQILSSILNRRREYPALAYPSTNCFKASWASLACVPLLKCQVHRKVSAITRKKKPPSGGLVFFQFFNSNIGYVCMCYLRPQHPVVIAVADVLGFDNSVEWFSIPFTCDSEVHLSSP
ncbi:hypothetical protein ETEC_0781 [Escherichia coli ETEC H10407]|nr:hypothetical protein ETEC_0781 [Escherichia coli ETEC H10407]